jgi:putative hemolysin
VEADSYLSTFIAIPMVDLTPPSPGIIMGIIMIIFLLFLSALIAGSEAAFFSLKPKDKKMLSEMDTKNSDRVLNILKRPERLLATVLIGNNFVNIGIVIISTFIITHTFDFSQQPVLGFLFQVIIVTFLILLFGEIVPKIYASQNAVWFSLIMSYPILLTEKFFYPISGVLLRSTSFVNRKLAHKRSKISMDDLNDALDLTTGVVTEDKKILKSIVKFSNIEVNEVMRQRLDVVAIDIETDFQRLIDIINESGYSRIPVYTETFDNINGILYVKDLLPFLEKSDQFKWQELIRPCYYVPETKKINALLQEFLAKKIHMAIVVDEYGGTEGIVTLEDILEEIVGEITDESDEIETFFTRLDEMNYIFDAKILLNDFYKIVQVPKDTFENIRGEADTLAGLILEIKGEIPRLNEVITLKNFTFTITSVDSRRIKKVKFTLDKPIKNSK